MTTRNFSRIAAAAAILVMCHSNASAQGGITAGMLQSIQTAQAKNGSNKALANAIANISIDQLAMVKHGKGDFDDHWTIETPKQNIHDQQASGRCWMFSGLNVLRSDFALSHGDSLKVEFSHAYLFFWDQLEKANLMLQAVIDKADKPMEDPVVRFFFKNPISDGGTFCGVADLASKYGLAPMTAQPETFSSESTARMSRLVASKLREYGLELRRMAAAGKKAKQLEARKTEMLSTVYRMLSLTLGEPVREFKYTFRNAKGDVVIPEKTYTPKEFYDFTVGKDLNGTFIMVMNDPRREFHKTYEVEFDRHTYDGHNWKYLNLPADEIAQLAIAQLKAGHKIYSSYDVGKQSDRKSGYASLGTYDYGMLFDTDFPMDKADRIATYDSGSTHAMTLTAVDLDADGKPLKWKVENSWSASSGANGYMIMSGDWWNEYMFRLVVDRQYVPQQLLDEFDRKPELVTQDDPLFDFDD